MNNRKKWETAVSYLAGFFVLAVSVILAWFVPGAYSDWQDQRLLKVSVLSSRNDIEFLDMEALEMEERMRLLKETERLSFTEHGGIFEIEDWERRAVCQRELQRWMDCGLIPERAFPTGNYVEMGGAYISLTNSVLECNILIFGDETGEYTFVIMDGEKEILYYVAMWGTSIQEYMAETLGYENLEHMIWQVFQGELLQKQEDYSGYDFAQVCRAKAADIQGSPEELNFDVSLEYDTFTGYAHRRVINTEGVYGLSVSLGTEKWEKILEEISGGSDFYSWEEGTARWQQHLVMEAYGVEQTPEDFQKNPG